MVWILPIFLIFFQFWLFFGQEKAQKCKNRKIVFWGIFFCWEASTYPILVNFIELFEFCQFSSFWINFDSFLAKNGKKSGSLMNFHLLKCIYIPNCRKFFPRRTVTNTQTDGRRHKGESIGPFGLQPGTNKTYDDLTFYDLTKKKKIANLITGFCLSKYH